MAEPERTFRIEVDAGGRKMACETRATSVGQLAERAAERFGIRFREVKELQINASTIKIKITSSEIPSGDSP